MDSKSFSTTTLIIAGVFGLLAGFAIHHFLFEPSPPFVPPITESSIRIDTYREAAGLMQEYQTDAPLYVQYTNERGEPEVKVLEGFIFDAEDLFEIITDNHSNKGNPDKVIFYLGKQGVFTHTIITSDTTTTTVDRPVMHLIATGIKDDTLLFDDKTGNGASIFDKAVPCPPFCPYTPDGPGEEEDPDKVPDLDKESDQ